MTPDAFPVRVFYEDTDLGGIVYHANYLRFIERARSDWVAGLGLDQMALRAAGLIFVVHRVEADFVAAARFDDRLLVRTALASCTGVRMVLDQSVWRDATELFRARVTVVCMTLDGRPQRLPAEIRALQ